MTDKWPNSTPRQELENCLVLLRAALAGDIIPAVIVNQIDRAEAVLEQTPEAEAAATLGRIGGASTSPRKSAASRANGLRPTAPGKSRGRPKTKKESE